MGHDVDRLVVTIFIYLFVVIIFLYDYIRVPTTGFSSSVGVRIYLDVIFNMYYGITVCMLTWDEEGVEVWKSSHRVRQT